MTNRRTFIKQSALLTAGALLTPGSLRYARAGQHPKVIIIGAGFSGLAAAHKLRTANWDVTVLESTNRISGRVFSHPISPELTIELGGEWVGNSHTRIQELCGEYKLELFNNQLDTALIYKSQYYPKGQWNYSASWQAKFKQLLEGYVHLSDADKQALDQYDWWRYLVNNGCNGRDLEIRELLDSTDFGESIRQVSAFAALAEYAESSEKNEMDLKIRGGNSALAKKLALAIGPEHILLQQQVTRVVQTADKVTVYCTNGRHYEADKLICTIPTFAVQKIDWQPGLPAEKLQALRELQYARINKQALLFSQRFWKDDAFDLITDELPHYFYHGTKNQPTPKGVLISYSTGDKAAVMAGLTDERKAAAIFQTLKPAFGDVKPLMEQQVNYYWGQDERSMGAYALYGPGQWFSVLPLLKAPYLHTHFAGEHLADWQGFMEGAINSGEDAADELL